MASKSGMRIIDDKKRLINIFLLLCLATSPSAVSQGVEHEQPTPLRAQQSYPPIPGDLTRIYYLDTENKLVPLPFEKGLTPVNVYSVAEDSRMFEVRVNGPQATTILRSSTPSFYVFVADRMDPPPHLLVRLTSKGGARRLTIARTKGRTGYETLSEEDVRLEYRILERLSVEAGKGRIIFVNYMEIHARQPLGPGEYAIIGDSLADIATFRIE